MTNKPEHDLRWAATPKGVVKLTPWGYLSACVCGWEQTGLAGTKKEGQIMWRIHRDNPETFDPDHAAT